MDKMSKEDKPFSSTNLPSPPGQDPNKNGENRNALLQQVPQDNPFAIGSQAEREPNMNGGNRNTLLQQVPQDYPFAMGIQAEREPNMNGENRNTLLQQVPQDYLFAMGIQPEREPNMNGENRNTLLQHIPQDYPFAMGIQAGQFSDHKQQFIQPTPPPANKAEYGTATDVNSLLDYLFSKRPLGHFVSDKSVILNAFKLPDKINIRNSSYTEGNNFRIVKNAGKGAFGEVHICQENASNFQFAKKTIQLSGNIEKALSSIRREVEALLWCNSEFIVKLIGIRVYQTDNYMYPQIDIYLENGGNSLKMYLTRNVPDEPKMLTIFLHILLAIDYLHVNEYAHTDLHPSNILTDAFGQVKLCDLGSIKKFGDHLFTLPAGYTAAYFPPTVLKKYLKKENICVTGRLDTFPVGKILLEAVTGRINSLVTVEEMIKHFENKYSWESFAQSFYPQVLPPYRTYKIQWLIENLMSYNTRIDAAAAITYIVLHRNN